MLRQRIMAALAALAVTGVLAVALPMASASSATAAACVTAWNSSTVYVGGTTASHNGRNWSAKWWTQNETPGTAAVWADQGACGGGTTPPPSGNCNHPNWAAGTWYAAGSIVKYTNGQFYRAKNENPGYDPVISTWYWEPYTCGGTTPPPTNPPTGGFVVSEAQFNQMFPSRNSFYTYSGLTAALSAYPGFAKTGSDTIRRQEAAAFLANVNHETGGLVHVVEQNTANYPHYCDASQSYGCPAGQAAYYGRGPIQLSWNFNYKAAGDALGINLLGNPYLVQNDAAVAWKTALWYWNTQNGPGTMTPHNAMINSRGFGETIRSINGSLECNGRNPAQVQSRINAYQRFVQILGTTPGGNLSC
ncbi:MULTISPECIES: glycoside hydrolase family 19 protein [unclassified Streptosporangium]|uniref:glycoside hydrolase family 19 protein n=1 Tax=unclassified Streptosporangium TaxID=2632669 RepID=UPI002E2886AE|nr:MULTISPECIES: glycoside hydrolase family 19 protein [unclassified Streptosporangium]